MRAIVQDTEGLLLHGLKLALASHARVFRLCHDPLRQQVGPHEASCDERALIDLLHHFLPYKLYVVILLYLRIDLPALHLIEHIRGVEIVAALMFPEVLAPLGESDGVVGMAALQVG